MPITLQVPGGIFTDEEQADIFKKITWTILRINGVDDNPVAIRNLIGDVYEAPIGKTFGGGVATPVVNITIRAPTFSLGTKEKRQEFAKEITDFIMNRSHDQLERDRIYINMIHGDAFWGIGGVAYTEDMLLNEVAKDQATH